MYKLPQWTNWREVERLKVTSLTSGAGMVCLGTTKSGAPRHPLYVKSDAPLVAYYNGHNPAHPWGGTKR